MATECAHLLWFWGRDIVSAAEWEVELKIGTTGSPTAAQSSVLPVKMRRCLGRDCLEVVCVPVCHLANSGNLELTEAWINYLKVTIITIKNPNCQESTPGKGTLGEVEVTVF